MSGAHGEARLGWLLCAPALLAFGMLTLYPLADALWLSLQRYDLRVPDTQAFVGLANYAAVLGSALWWEALGTTLFITLVSVAIELVLGMAIALTLHHATFGRRFARAATLVPYAIVTVVAALAWKLGVDPVVGVLGGGSSGAPAWLAERGPALAVIIAAEVWKTTPFMALLLLAGLTLVPEDALKAARVDGASRAQRFWRITLPIMRPVIVVAVLFRALDAFRIFDTVFVLTRGAQGTETVSMIAYSTIVSRLNLGLGATVSVLTLACAIVIAVLVVGPFRRELLERRR